MDPPAPAAQADARRPVFDNLWQTVFAGGVLVTAFLWTFWPTFAHLIATWNRDPDYSHGYFVMPLAAFFLWRQRHSFPGFGNRLFWGGLIVVCLSGAINIGASLWYIESLQAWSIPVWVGGVCWFLGGWPLLRWCLPAIVFLGFMIPLPFRAETLLSLPLQRVATQLSCWILESLGQPAIAEGNVIDINGVQLAVAEACSGLRIFMSIIALAFVFAVLTQKPWWMKVCLFLGVLPVTLIANAVRISATGLLTVYVSNEAAHLFGHDLAGWLMIVFAAALLGAVLWYLGRLVVEVETISTHELLSSSNRKMTG